MDPPGDLSLTLSISGDRRLATINIKKNSWSPTAGHPQEKSRKRENRPGATERSRTGRRSPLLFSSGDRPSARPRSLIKG